MDGPGHEIVGPTPDERTWAMLCHLSASTTFVIGIGFIVGPLVVWLIKRDSMPFVDRAGREALNFNISWMIWFIASAILMLVLIGFVMILVLAVAWIVLVIVAGVRASGGVEFRYPLTIRFIK